ncbi:phage distal tail protein [Thomasclavelia spiroformis]|jgi:hypothetical protein|uniref:Tail protein n=1 Tax=Myoviridae sp. ct1AP5 TaxID=2825017 RepID=A0A8S5UE41_9CAUD|nr:phage tail domain-containing protein [Thomasclavelia spiroformis]DAF92666.1 MAG TPA: tail protein [Myoviridae sp. ct1AP5]
MFRLEVENEKKEKIELTNSPFYESVAIEGLLPPQAAVNSSAVANADGETFNSARVGIRDVTIDIKPAFPVEENRQRLYTYFKLKKQVNIYFKNKNRDIVTAGIVEGFDGSLFEQKQLISISIKCLDPYLKDSAESVADMANIIDNFEFPFSIDKEGIPFSIIDKALTQNIFNAGDVETGMIIELTANGEVIKPTIYNVETREYFGLDFTMQLGDVIRINTNKFNKKVELIRYGETRNIINNILKGNKWLTLQVGDNLFTYTCEAGEENLSFKFTYSNRYEGV